MIVRMNMEFRDWLSIELERRRMSQSDLARAIHMNQGSISRLLSGKTSPTIETLQAIARAFQMSVTTVYRAASVLKDLPVKDALAERIANDLDKLDPHDRDEVLAFIQMKLDRRRK